MVDSPVDGFGIQTVLFFLEENEDTLASQMEEMVADLGNRCDWVLGRPVFIDQAEPAEQSGDFPIRTVGGYFEIHSRFGGDGERLSRDVDTRHYKEVNAAVEAMRAFSELFNAEIGFEIAGERVGSIRAGRPSRFLIDGLLEPWRATLGL